MITKIGLLIVAFFIAITSLNAQDLTKENTEKALSGLPGENFDLYAALDLFQKSKTIEEFQESLNSKKTGINNLDLDLDNDVDFIKVVTQKEGDDFTFILQVDIIDDEIQDVAVILVTKNKDKTVTIQMVGDEGLYGENYVIEPKSEIPAITANPAYSGTAVIKSQPATVVALESEPIVKYVYSPIYVPYYPPYYYGYYPVYYTPYPVISFNIYFGRHRHHHHHYHGGHRGGNTVIINNNKTYNNYSKKRSTSNTVNKYKNEGSYTRNNTSKRSSSSTIKNNRVMNQKSVPNANKMIQKEHIKQKSPSLPRTQPNVRPSVPKTSPNARPSSKQQNKPKRNQRGN